MYNPFNPPLAAILGSLNNTVTQLEKFVAKADADCTAKVEQAEVLMAEARALGVEATHASSVITNIRKLIA